MRFKHFLMWLSFVIFLVITFFGLRVIYDNFSTLVNLQDTNTKWLYPEKAISINFKALLEIGQSLVDYGKQLINN